MTGRSNLHTAAELLQLLKSVEFRDRLRHACFILVTDAGSDCDDIMALDVLEAHGLRPSLIVTTMYHPSEKCIQVMLHLYARNITNVPVVPGLGYDESESGTMEDFQKAHAWWPKVFKYPVDKDSVIGRHWENYKENLQCDIGVLQKVVDHVRETSKNKNAWIDAVKDVVEKAKKTQVPLFFLGLAPLKCEAEIVRRGLLDGVDEVYALIMNGGFMEHGTTSYPVSIINDSSANVDNQKKHEPSQYKLKRVGYNFMMDPAAADMFLKYFPGTVIVVTSELWQKCGGYLPEDKYDELIERLSKTDVGRSYAADIKLFREKKYRTGTLPLADCYVSYLATHLEDVKKLTAVKFHATSHIEPSEGENFLNVDPSRVTVLEKVETSHVFFIDDIEYAEKANVVIIDSVLREANNIQNSFRTMQKFNHGIKSQFGFVDLSMPERNESQNLFHSIVQNTQV